ncbi:uncharacterized protein LOC135469868 [Liolophura sinensis]|uniref:uncharacterized protein LOC135469868 n=1 Tax=Liolophura sinensis TaxID=3198878 RepID=UPI0031594782
MVKVKTKKPREGINKANHSMNPDRVKGQGGSNMRDKSTIRRLQMYRNFKPKRDRRGKIVQPAPFQSRLPSGSVARVEPKQTLVGNTRVVTQNALQTFQEELGKVMRDPYKVVMRQTQLPVTLLNETAKHARVHLLDTESFESTFGKKSIRKRPNMKVADMETLLAGVEASNSKYDVSKDSDLVTEVQDMKDEPLEVVFKAGQSKRVWNELYKVIDSSDVVVQVLDARDPLGTRCYQVEEYLRKEKPHKHLIFVLNKVDLIPVWVTKKWVAILSQDHPTMAFHASLTNPFGKGALINLLRQFGKLHQDHKQISVGFIGYPNTGKSSIINALRSKKVCNVAPIAGETKVWQYVTLMKRIYLVDCPGVVYPTASTPTDCVLKGVVRVEYVKAPEDYVAPMLDRIKPEYVKRTYKIEDWKNHEDFLEQVARKSGKLLKGGEPDISTVAKMVLNDFVRGKIPYFTKPPGSEGEGVDEKPCDKQEEKIPSEPVSEKPKVKQNLRKIQVDAEYVGEDVKDEDLSDGESDSELEREAEVEEEEGEATAAGRMPETAAETVSPPDREQQPSNSKGRQPVGNDQRAQTGHSDINKSSVKGKKSRKMVKQTESSVNSKQRKKSGKRNSHTPPDMEETSKRRNVHVDKNTGISMNITSGSSLVSCDNAVSQSAAVRSVEYRSSTSGNFRILDQTTTSTTDEAAPMKEINYDSKFFGCKVKQTGQVAVVEVVPVDKSKSDQRKRSTGRRADEKDNSLPSISSREKRKLARQERSKKIGVHFYKNTDVKNRSFRR